MHTKNPIPQYNIYIPLHVFLEHIQEEYSKINEVFIITENNYEIMQIITLYLIFFLLFIIL